MALNARSLSILATGLIGLACLFFILSNALPSWGTASAFGISASLGLWQGCTSGFGPSKCASISCSSSSGVDCGELYAARAFVTLACMISGILTIAILLSTRNIEYINESRMKIVKIMAIVCLIVGIIGVSLGIHETATGASWGAASYLAILAILLNLGGAVAIAMVK